MEWCFLRLPARHSPLPRSGDYSTLPSPAHASGFTLRPTLPTRPSSLPNCLHSTLVYGRSAEPRSSVPDALMGFLARPSLSAPSVVQTAPTAKYRCPSVQAATLATFLLRTARLDVSTLPAVTRVGCARNAARAFSCLGEDHPARFGPAPNTGWNRPAGTPVRSVGVGSNVSGNKHTKSCPLLKLQLLHQVLKSPDPAAYLPGIAITDSLDLHLVVCGLLSRGNSREPHQLRVLPRCRFRHPSRCSMRRSRISLVCPA